MSLSATPQTNVIVGTTTATSTTVDMRNFEYARIGIPAGSSLTALTVHEEIQTEDGQGDWYEANETALTVAAGKTYQLPASFAACGRIKFTGNVAGVINIQRK